MTEPGAAAPPARTTEERLSAVTIGDRKPHDAPVTLVAYDPAWPEMYEREARRIRAALGSSVLLLEHTGSTSVPGLAAKPIIDITMSVARSADEGAYVPRLEAAGYVLRIREPHWHEHRLLKGPEFPSKVHVFSRDSVEIARMVGFRDWLRTHPDDRDLYQRVKRELAARTWRFVQDYADAKTAVVEEIMARAGLPGPVD